ncbi:hypothetical protein G195_001287 [Phytophthora kernoviae 00238/432]|uniref:1-deoxy-D-xylulose-5-phosphate synthase n=1 Tax=Phytophthora kernoviae 00238/432 TaxID=1284355 RepID=A0A8J4WB54_9STRA|nr:hypothetical protein G195_001287 [Phytophthora kernoviae 00238/432]
MSQDDLVLLSAEIRQFLIEKLSVTGGHLAPNLGVVELTVALHYCYNSPVDKMIFDVGHQAYVHKVLTGRMDRFDTLRQHNGMCGFVKRNESEHDVWEAGHSSTSLSAAMGMALARDLKGEDNQVIAMIGDGALTGGMAFEALNHIGHEQKKLMVILNDNEMSIAPNVGAMHKYLSKIRSDRHYLKAKDDVEGMLKKIPAIGDRLAKSASWIKDSVKYMMVPGVLFEELGFTYLGPIDGHDIPKLIETFRQADNVDGPVMVHVLTTKDLAKQDKRIVAVTPAMPTGSGLIPFSKEFPDRMIDVGIAEQHAATMCAALAMEGLKPVFAVYSTFMQRAYDQIVHDICRHNANVMFAIDRAGFVGPDGETHQGVYDVAFMRHIPNIVLMMPKDENELRHMMKTALEYNEGPIAYRYPRNNVVGVPLDDELIPIPIGTWEQLRPSEGYAIIASGSMVQLAEEAAETVKREGITVGVINARFLKPLDEQILRDLAVRGTKLIVLEEASQAGSMGSAVLEFYAEQGLHDVHVQLMGIPDRFIEHGSIEDQRAEVGLTVENVSSELRSMAAQSSYGMSRTRFPS